MYCHLKQPEFAEENRRTVLARAYRPISSGRMQNPDLPATLDQLLGTCVTCFYTDGLKCKQNTACRAPVLNSLGNDVTLEILMHEESGPRLQRERWDTPTIWNEMRETTSAATKPQGWTDVSPFLQCSRTSLVSGNVRILTCDGHLSVDRHHCWNPNR